MGIYFNADEIFEIAEQIERNGARFYRQAAESKNIKKPQHRQLLLNLSAMEERHEKVFSAMRADMLKRGGTTLLDPQFDPEGEAAMYLRAMADGYVFDVKVDPTEYLTEEKTVEDIFHIAIDREKDSVIFYLGMKEMVPKDMGQKEIDKIIREEMSHITDLSRQLAEIHKAN